MAQANTPNFPLPVSEDSWGKPISPVIRCSSSTECTSLLLLPPPHVRIESTWSAAALPFVLLQEPHTYGMWAVAFTYGLSIMVGWGSHCLTAQWVFERWNLAMSVLNSPLAVACSENLWTTICLEKTFLQGAGFPHCPYKPLFVSFFRPFRGSLCTIQILI